MAKKDKEDSIESIRKEKLVYEFHEAADIIKLRVAPTVELDILNRLFALGYKLISVYYSYLKQPVLYLRKGEAE
jgi:hypothetical protein